MDIDRDTDEDIDVDVDDDDRVTFTVGETFSLFEDLKEKVSAFEKDNFVQLYIR